ncbi:hypothetical protein ACFL9T_06435 [Thermodesulfobacteriota bacterium]
MMTMAKLFFDGFIAFPFVKRHARREVRGHEMESCREILQQDIDLLLVEAVEDLRKSGLDNKEIFSVVKKHFGLQYANKFCIGSSDDASC